MTVPLATAQTIKLGVCDGRIKKAEHRVRTRDLGCGRAQKDAGAPEPVARLLAMWAPSNGRPQQLLRQLKKSSLGRKFR
jgi:hypothetical protein